MKISKHSIIELEGGHKYLMLNAQRIGERNFCLLFAPIIEGQPVSVRVGELSISEFGEPQIELYEGDEYDDILKQLLHTSKIS